MKQCITCKQALPLSSFGRDKTQADGLNIYCSVCARKRNREWVRKNYGKQHPRISVPLDKSLLTAEQIAYAAGLFDGEGTLVIALEKPQRTYRLQVTITNTNKDVIEYTKKLFNGFITTRPQKGVRKTAYKWVGSAWVGCDFLEAVYPYLIVKKEQAKLGIEFQHRNRIDYNGHKYSEYERSISDNYKQLISKLNNGG